MNNMDILRSDIVQCSTSLPFVKIMECRNVSRKSVSSAISPKSERSNIFSKNCFRLIFRDDIFLLRALPSSSTLTVKL